MAPGESAVIEIYFRRDPESLDLRRLAFANEAIPTLEQIDASVLRTIWQDHSVDAPLGDAIQMVDYREPPCDPGPCPGYALDLYGTQTVRLNSVGDGDPLEITFDLASIQITSFLAFNYGYLASSSPALDHTNTYHIGVGSPGYEDSDGFMDERDPLIVIPIPEPSGLLGLGLLVATAALRRRGR